MLGRKSGLVGYFFVLFVVAAYICSSGAVYAQPADGSGADAASGTDEGPVDAGLDDGAADDAGALDEEDVADDEDPVDEQAADVLNDAEVLDIVADDAQDITDDLPESVDETIVNVPDEPASGQDESGADPVDVSADAQMIVPDVTDAPQPMVLAAVESLSPMAIEPKAVGERYIILRSNDIAAWWSTGSAVYVTDYIRNMGVPQTLAVIPIVNEMQYELGSDPVLTDYLKSISNDPDIEIGMHGMYHTSMEFEGLTQADAEERLVKGKEIFRNTLSIEPVTFIPPYFAYDVNALNAAKSQGFLYFSAGWNAIDNGHGFTEFPAGLWNIPATTDFYDWGNNRFFTPQEIETACENAMDAFGTCDLLLLHYTFQDASGNIDPQKIEVLRQVMEWVKTKESEGVKLKTIGKHKAVSPPEPKMKKIVFRSDDIGAWWGDESAIAITEMMRNEGIPQVLSLVPANQYGDALTDDPLISGYLAGIKDDTSIEFALHGYDHRQDEFKSLSYSNALSKISNGVTILDNLLGFKPVSFVPPYNLYNANTLTALSNQDIRIISSNSDDVWSGIAFKEVDGILHMPQTTDFYRWDLGRLNTASEIKDSCEGALAIYGACVIVLHHTLFLDSNGNLDPAKVQILSGVVDWAKALRESGDADIVLLKDINVSDLI